MNNKLHIKKGDNVVVISGADKGKKGKKGSKQVIDSFMQDGEEENE